MWGESSKIKVISEAACWVEGLCGLKPSSTNMQNYIYPICRFTTVLYCHFSITKVCVGTKERINLIVSVVQGGVNHSCAWGRVNPGFIFLCLGKLIGVEASRGLGGFARRGRRHEITGTGCPDKRSWGRWGEIIRKIIHLAAVSSTHRDGGFSGEGTAPGRTAFFWQHR